MSDLVDWVWTLLEHGECCGRCVVGYQSSQPPKQLLTIMATKYNFGDYKDLVSVHGTYFLSTSHIILFKVDHDYTTGLKAALCRYCMILDLADRVWTLFEHWEC